MPGAVDAQEGGPGVAQATRVLVVDDNELMRRGVRAALDNVPDIEIVGEASNGREALARVRELRPDIVLLDSEMPVLDGPGAAAELATSDDLVATRVIIVSYHREREHVLRSTAVGVSGYLATPTTAQELLTAIRQVMAGGMYFSPLVTPVVAEAMRGVAGPGRPPSGPADTLTTREREVMDRVARVYDNEQIAEELGITSKTVANHLTNVYTKLGAADRLEAIRMWNGQA